MVRLVVVMMPALLRISAVIVMSGWWNVSPLYLRNDTQRRDVSFQFEWES